MKIDLLWWPVLLFASVCVYARAPLDVANIASPDGVVHADDRIMSLIFRQPRDYAVMVLLTAEGPQFNCHFCNVLGPEVRAVAQTWRAKHPDGDGLHFVVADIANCPKAFETLQQNSAPYLLLYPVSEGSQTAGLHAPHETLAFSRVTDLRDLVAEFLTRHGFPVRIVKPFPWERLAKAAATLAVVAVSSYALWPKLVKLLTSKQLWLALSLVSILLFICGHMFNVIRKTPLTGWNNGHVVYFEQGFTTQLGIETQILAVVYAIMSFSAICLIVKVPALTDRTAQATLAVVLAALLLVTYSEYIAIFRYKIGNYPYRLLPISMF